MIIYCKLCNYSCKTNSVLCRHLSYHHKDYTTKSYYDEFLCSNGDNRKCRVCGVDTKFIGFTVGYSQHCSQSCATKSQWINDDGTRKDAASKFVSSNPIPSPGRKGKKNNNPYPRTEKVLRRYEEHKPPSWSGKKHSEETKLKISEGNIRAIVEGRKTMRGSYKGKFTPKNPQKYMGNPDNIIYRSSWELKFMTRLDTDSNITRWASEEFSIAYFSVVDNRTRRYFPDFYVENVNGDKFVFEIKPDAQTRPPAQKSRQTKRYITEVSTYLINKSKWTAAEKFCEERGWQFKIVTEKDLF